MTFAHYVMVILMTFVSLLGSTQLDAKPVTVSQAQADSLRQVHRQLFDSGDVRGAVSTAQAELILRQRSAPEARELVSTLLDLGEYTYLLGEFAAADSLLRIAQDLGSETWGREDARYTKILLGRVGPLIGMEQPDRARKLGATAHALHLTVFGEDDPRTAESHHWLGEVEKALGPREQGAFDRGQKHFQEALRIRRMVYGPRHALVAVTLTSLGHLKAWISELDQAYNILREAVDIEKEQLPPDHFRRAEALLHLAFTARLLGDNGEATELLAEHLRILELSLPDHPRVLASRGNLAILMRDSGRYEEAEQLILENLERFREIGDVSTRPIYQLANLARFKVDQGDYESATRYLQSAEQEIQRAREAGIDVTHPEITIHDYLCTILLGRGDYEEAETELALLVKRFQETLPDAHREVVRLREQMGAARLALGDPAGAETYLDEAVAVFEKARLLTGGGARAATFQRTPYEARALVRLEQGEMQKAWEDVELARGRVLGGQLMGELEKVSLQRIQACLSPQEAVVGWVDHELIPRRMSSWVYVIRDSGPVIWKRIESSDAEQAALIERLRVFRGEMASYGFSAFIADTGTDTDGHAHAIWANRFALAEDALEGARSLILIPSGIMSGLPFDALVDTQGQLLVERFALRLAPSSTVLAHLNERRDSRDNLGGKRGLLLGDPAFCPEHLAEWSLGNAVVGSPDLAMLRSATRGDAAAAAKLPRLPWTRFEVKGIAQYLPAATVLLGAEASADTLRRLADEERLVEYDILHLASHALVDAERPERSSLLLAQVTASERHSHENIAITASEIGEHWKLDAELVALSACETALGRPIFGDGTISFGYPLFVAGAQSVLSTLWAVNDRASALLMERFYANWLNAGGANDMTKEEALRRAKVWLRTWRDSDGNTAYSHPYYWAAFVLAGR